MKKLLFTLLMLSFFLTEGKSQFNAGVGLTYKFETSNFGFQAKSVIGLADKWRIAPSFSYFLGSEIDFSIEAEMQYELFTIGESLNIFPLAGLNWTQYDGNDPDIGLTIGLFSDFRINDQRTHLYIEPKYLISDFSSFILSAGIMF